MVAQVATRKMPKVQTEPSRLSAPISTVRRLTVTVGVLLGAAIAVSLLWANLSAIALR
jgi:hypothetical protein